MPAQLKAEEARNKKGKGIEGESSTEPTPLDPGQWGRQKGMWRKARIAFKKRMAGRYNGYGGTRMGWIHQEKLPVIFIEHYWHDMGLTGVDHGSDIEGMGVKNKSPPHSEEENPRHPAPEEEVHMVETDQVASNQCSPQAQCKNHNQEVLCC